MRVRKFGKTFSVNGQVGAQTVKGKHESYEGEGRTRVRHLHQRRKETGVPVKNPLLREYRMFPSFIITRVGKRLGTCVEESGHE